MKIFKSILLFVFIFCSYTVFPQFSLDGEFRPRAMADLGYQTIKLKSDPLLFYISQRTRINFGYKNEKLETYFSLQDVRFWGDDDIYKPSVVSGNTKGVSIHQAWFMLKPAQNISIKIGRQLLSYDDQRILSARNWNDYQVTYDVLLFKFDNQKDKIDLAFSWNSNGSSDELFPKGKLKTLNFIRYEREINKLSLSAIAMVTGNTEVDSIPGILLTGTYGVGVTYTENDYNLRFNGYYQNNLNEKAGNISAYCLSVFGQKKFFESKAALGIGLDYYSGHDDTNTDESYMKTKHYVYTMYGNRHGFLGFMDYFNAIPKNGIQDFMLKAEYSLLKDLRLKADYHYFMYSAKSYDTVNTTELANKGLGSELDLVLDWIIIKEATLQAGYSFMLPTETLLKNKGVYGKETKFPQFAYLMITVKPKFL